MSATEAEIGNVLHGAAYAPLQNRSFLRITGEDRTRWLNGMVTNNIAALQPGEGNYNFLLNAQGRIQGDCTVFRDPDGAAELLLETGSNQAEPIQQLLDRFIIMDDVELMPVMDDQEGLLLLGPEAPKALTALGLPSLLPLHAARPMYSSQPVLLLAPHAPLVPTVELWAAPATIAALRTALAADAAHPVEPSTLEALRILSGTPAYGIDIRNSETAKDLPQETAQPHALHFAKGCYLGQEIVERIRSRGQVHRTFTGFTLSGPVPSTLPAPLTGPEGRALGELTSAVTLGGTVYALGYARREALDLNQPLAYEGGTAIPARLPFPNINF